MKCIFMKNIDLWKIKKLDMSFKLGYYPHYMETFLR